MDDAELTAKLLRFMEAREERDATKKAASEAEREYREQEAELWEYIEESDFDRSIPRVLPGYGRVLFTQKETPYGKAVDKQALREWARQNNLEGEIFSEPRVSDRKLNEIARDARDSHSGLPPGMDVNTRQYVAIERRG
jgi:hypothetical protein